ncbi:MAG: hypothetical protein C7B45_13685 [Sulfobacillus acidophilus]|uniref:Uncharacterized protein n=1 Tax=Sulfobacillus acidophilus TaxID=53633 RepID=A0A2T2WES8_9FIRM|nr:MAG: hypothetical protein C7B45_13685 [Sulfobacillus acidophilus]
MPPTAVVKVGSTSTTLLLAERLDSPLRRAQELVDLFSEDGIARITAMAQEWSAYLGSLGVRVLAAGGEATRTNPALERQLQQFFPNWWHLTGTMEGRLAWLAVKSRHPAAELVIDIGGGSTEIISSRIAWTFPVGATRFDAKTINWPPLDHFAPPVVIGGTAVTLAQWAACLQLDRLTVKRMHEQLTYSPEKFQNMEPMRRKILPTGLALLDSVLAHGRWNQFQVSPRGLTEGLWIAASLGRGGSNL